MRRISCNARFDLDLCVGLNLAAHDCYKNEEGQRGKIADRANIFPVGFPGLVPTVYEVGGVLLALGCEQLVSLAVPSWCRRAQ